MMVLPLADESPRRRPRIGLVVWELTLRCNLACRLCGSRAGRPREHELTTDEALALVPQIAALGATEVTLSGGEAYLRPDCAEIARAITEHGMLCSMVTAGRDLDASMATRLREAGVAHISISLDGCEAAHDELRGVPGAFRSGVLAIRNVIAADMTASVNTQVNRRTQADLEDLLALLDQEGVSGWQVQLTVPMGRAADRPELLLQPYELLDLFPRLARLKAGCINRGIGLWLANDLGYFGPYEALLRGDTTPVGHWGGCAAATRTLGIEADGTVKGCLSLPSQAFAGGNVRERPLADILENAEPLRSVRERGPADLWGHCRGCYYSAVCRGGCTWTSHALLGRTGNDPYCYYRAAKLARSGRRERVVRVSPAAGGTFDCARFELVEEPIPQ